MILSGLVNHAEDFRKGGQPLQGAAMKRASSLEDNQFSRRAALRGLAVAAGPGHRPRCPRRLQFQHEQRRQCQARRRPAVPVAAPSPSAPTTPTPRRRRPSPPWSPAPTKATGVKIAVNTIDHNTFQNNITAYLQGTPDDLATWFAGYRCSTSPRRVCSARSTTCGTRSARNFSDAVKALSQGAGRPLLLRADLQLPVGGLLQQERLRAEGLHRPRPPGTTSSRWPRR